MRQTPPAILTTREEIDQWMTAPAEEALASATAADDALITVARGRKKDEGGLAA